ncbi:MAG: hypothetical protein R2865_02275 [Deinococcales bacterium]
MVKTACWIQFNWIQSNWIQFNWIQGNWIQSNWIQFNWIQSNWIQGRRMLFFSCLETLVRQKLFRGFCSSALGAALGSNFLGKFYLQNIFAYEGKGKR